MTLTYGSYLRLEDLLDLQRPLSEGPEHDELLFIVVHQVYELWFKVLLHEFDRLLTLFARSPAVAPDPVPDVLHALKRARTVMKTMVEQIDVLETMTPLSFESFRARLESASGFQSAQFRELEFVLGRRDAALARRAGGGADLPAELARRQRQPSVYQAFLGFVHARGYPMPAEVLRPYADGGAPVHAGVRRALLEVYRRDPGLLLVCELMVDFDEGLQEWRYRHVKMVERTIGTKGGTGGSSGAEYLRTTLFHPLFPDLWGIRTEL